MIYAHTSSAAGALIFAAPKVHASNPQLATAAVVGIATVVILIAWVKLHPLLGLTIGSAVLGLISGLGPTDTVSSFTAGFGSTTGSVGLLIALGAMIGGLLTDTGGANRIVNTVVGRVGARGLPWAMGGVAALVGLPLFFEIGVVLVVPIVLLVARRADVPVLRVGIPALAGLSVLHGLVPPHPGPLVAIATLHADLGRTLAFGLIIAVPTVILAGPVFGMFISGKVHLDHPAPIGAKDGSPALSDDAPATRREPGFVPTVLTVLLPIAMMLVRAIGDLTLHDNSKVKSALDVIGEPSFALLVGVLVAMFTLGIPAGFTRQRLSDSTGGALPAIAGILLIVAAGGGFKQTLVDAGVANLVSDAAKNAHISALLLGWLVAVGIRLATGSATVATVTAAGIVSPLAAGMSASQVALLALAVGAGSLFFSHVNDAGFWLVKEYFGMSVGQTLATWSVMETIISVLGLGGVLLINLLV